MADILIVDDDRQIRVVLRHIVELDGHVAFEAASAADARKALQRQAFDLILCDVNMPGESGLDLVSGLMTANLESAVVMVTAVDQPEIAHLAFETGAYGFLTKPFSENQVRIAVMNALLRLELEIDNRKHRTQLVEALKDRTSELMGTVIKLERADRRIEASIEEVIRRLSLAAELKDDETGGHIERVGRYTGILAVSCGIEPRRTRLFELAARMHDIGKIGVPDRILRKAGKLTEAEFEVMKQHTTTGYAILSGSDAELLQIAAGIAWSHHERWDGTGYPRGLEKEDIPLEARISSVADAFDALTTRRVYRRALPLGEAVGIIRREAGVQFDPHLIRVFDECLPSMLEVLDEYLRNDA